MKRLCLLGILGMGLLAQPSGLVTIHVIENSFHVRRFEDAGNTCYVIAYENRAFTLSNSAMPYAMTSAISCVKSTGVAK